MLMGNSERTQPVASDDAAAKESERVESSDGAAAQATSKAAEAKLWTPYFILIVAIMFCSYVSFHGLNSGTSVYIERTGGTASFAGVLAALYSIVAGIIRMIVGPIIDRRGRTIVMSAGAASFTIGALIPGFLGSEPALVIGRILQGVGFGAITTSASTAAADVLPAARMGEGLGYYGLGNALAQSVGPAVALALVVLDPPQTLFLALAVAAMVVFLLTMLCNYERHPERLPEEASYRQQVESGAFIPGKGSTQPKPEKKETLAERFFEPHALPGAVPMVFVSAANGFSVFIAGVYGETLGIGNAGLSFTCAAVTMVLVRL